ncbi:MAG: hypothetical protein DLM52_10270 [Chthoniobacterales bacterium]|nr:MAG: hypothetical protein DLM52_10270 [Chthoniobacterales bacterium]
MKTHKSNTYDLVIQSQSEDKNRTVVEMLIYALLIGSAVVSIFQSAVQAVVMPARVATTQVCTPARPC